MNHKLVLHRYSSEEDRKEWHEVPEDQFFEPSKTDSYVPILFGNIPMKLQRKSENLHHKLQEA